MREQKTNNGRFIDLFIETKSTVIILENKIYFHDRDDQLSDYYKWGRDQYPNKEVIP